MATISTTEPLKKEESPSSPSSSSVKPIYDTHTKSAIPHSPETLEIISSEGTSPPAYSFANGTGISPIQTKPRKQVTFERFAAPAPAPATLLITIVTNTLFDLEAIKDLFTIALFLRRNEYKYDS